MRQEQSIRVGCVMFIAAKASRATRVLPTTNVSLHWE